LGTTNPNAFFGGSAFADQRAERIRERAERAGQPRTAAGRGSAAATAAVTREPEDAGGEEQSRARERPAEVGAGG
jgi:hypothetical protein